MIYIQSIPITETKARIDFIHNMPFDPKYGLNKSEAELEQTGRLIEVVPESNPPEGQQEAGLFINPQTNELWYEYAPIPQHPEDRISLLEQAIAELTIYISTGGVI